MAGPFWATICFLHVGCTRYTVDSCYMMDNNANACQVSVEWFAKIREPWDQWSGFLFSPRGSWLSLEWLYSRLHCCSLFIKESWPATKCIKPGCVKRPATNRMLSGLRTLLWVHCRYSAPVYRYKTSIHRISAIWSYRKDEVPFII